MTGWLGKAERRRERECKRGWLRWRTRGASKDAIRWGRPDRSQNQVYERVQRLRSIPVFVGPSRRKSWAERLEIGISAPFELDARLWRRATRNSFWRPSVSRGCKRQPSPFIPSGSASQPWLPLADLEHLASSCRPPLSHEIGSPTTTSARRRRHDRSPRSWRPTHGQLRPWVPPPGLAPGRGAAF